MNGVKTVPDSVVRRGAAIATCFMLIMASCGRSADTPGSSGSQARQSTELARRHVEIADLIERLAISNEPAADAPVFSPREDTPDTDPRVIAYDAAEKLRAFGKDAFPQLLGPV